MEVRIPDIHYEFHALPYGFRFILQEKICKILPKEAHLLNELLIKQGKIIF